MITFFKEVKKHLIFLLIIFSLGISFSFFLYLDNRHHIEEEKQFAFKNTSKAYLNIFKNDLKHNIEILNSINSFFNSSTEVEEDEFEEFAQTNLLSTPFISLLGFVPKISSTMKEDHEKRMHSLHSDYAIQKLSSDGSLQTLQDKTTNFYPLIFAQTTLNKNFLMGVDLSEDPEILKAFELAELSSDTVGTSLVTLNLNGQIFQGIFFVKKVNFNKEQKSIAFDMSASQDPLGFVVAFVPLHLCLRSEQATNPYQDVEVKLIQDISEKTSKNLFFNELSIIQDVAANLLPNPPSIYASEIFQIKNMTWKITTVPNYKGVHIIKQPMPAIALSLGLITTFVVIAYLYTTLTKTHRTQKLIDETTKELIKAKKLAEESDVIKSNFLLHISHQIKAPINAIYGTAELLHKSNLSEKQAQYMSSLNQSLSTLMSIVDDILGMSRLESGNLEMSSTSFNLRDFFEEIEKGFSLICSKRGLKFKIDYDHNTPIFVIADKKILQHILSNLINNAIKFTPSGQITVGVKGSKINDISGDFTFIVKDTGIGIAPDEVEYIFNKFHKADKNLYLNGKGIGLTIVKKFIDILNGTINVESKPDFGSIFKIHLKLELDPHHTEIPVPTIQKTSLKTKSLSNRHRMALIVDQDISSQEITKEFFELEGFETMETENGLDALALAKSFVFEVIVLDTSAEEANSYEIAQQIRDYEKTQKRKRVPIILLASSSLDYDKQKAIQSGIDALYLKPVDFKDLMEKVKDLAPL